MAAPNEFTNMNASAGHYPTQNQVAEPTPSASSAPAFVSDTANASSASPPKSGNPEKQRASGLNPASTAWVPSADRTPQQQDEDRDVEIAGMTLMRLHAMGHADQAGAPVQADAAIPPMPYPAEYPFALPPPQYLIQQPPSQADVGLNGGNGAPMAGMPVQADAMAPMPYPAGYPFALPPPPYLIQQPPSQADVGLNGGNGAPMAGMPVQADAMAPMPYPAGYPVALHHQHFLPYQAMPPFQPFPQADIGHNGGNGAPMAGVPVQAGAMPPMPYPAMPYVPYPAPYPWPAPLPFSHCSPGSLSSNGSERDDDALEPFPRFDPTFGTHQLQNTAPEDPFHHPPPPRFDLGRVAHQAQHATLEDPFCGPAPKVDHGFGPPKSQNTSAFDPFCGPAPKVDHGFGPPKSQKSTPVDPFLGPPPKFDLGFDLPKSQNTNSDDPFYSPPRTQAGLAQQLIRQSQPPRGQLSDKFKALTLTASGLPTLPVAMDPANFPFVEGAKQHTPVNHGVVKIRNIPFNTTRAEIFAFLGRNSRILNDRDEPVHIIMERVSSKTMDVYVEFHTFDDAMNAVEKHQQSVRNGHAPRLGDRPVDVELSSQGALMGDLFPHAIGLIWDGLKPQFLPHSFEEPWTNFKGFISEEEMTMLVKHVEVPQRSPYSRACPQRPYECLISTLKKFPWDNTDHYTIMQRHAIFKATCDMMRHLLRAIERKVDQVKLTMGLFRRLVGVAMRCPGFTVLQKDTIASLGRISDSEQKQAYGQPNFAGKWCHQYAIAPKPGVPRDVIDLYIRIIRDQTQRDTMTRHIQQRNDIEGRSRDTDTHWGHFWVEVGYMFGPAFDNLTVGQAGYLELSAVERVLSRALRPQ